MIPSAFEILFAFPRFAGFIPLENKGSVEGGVGFCEVFNVVLNLIIPPVELAVNPLPSTEVRSPFKF